jgi:hypothetical protein
MKVLISDNLAPAGAQILRDAGLYIIYCSMRYPDRFTRPYLLKTAAICLNKREGITFEELK